MTAAFWEGRRVFITGHTGFKGSWLCLWLERLGADIAGYALDPPTSPSLFEAAGIRHAIRSHAGDVRDATSLTACMAQHHPQVVFHLAAQPLVRRSYEAPLETYATNALGTANVLEAIRQVPDVRAAVIVTSDKCYDLRSGERRYAEDDALGGGDPYSASKAAAEFVVEAWRAAFWNGQTSGPAVASARAGNVIGGGDWARDRLVPDLIAAFAASQPARIREPDAVRPWQHVVDPIRGYVMLAQRLSAEDGARFAQAWNFGPDAANERRVSDLADEAASLWGTGASWTRDCSPHPREAASLRLDSAKAARLLRWQARIPIGTALERTIAWHKAYAGGANARALAEADIEALAMQTVGS